MPKCNCPYLNTQENRDRCQDELDARNREARKNPIILKLISRRSTKRSGLDWLVTKGRLLLLLLVLI